MDYITVREAASQWNISQRLVQKYCTSGRIQGAQKFGGSWAIPADAEKPRDLRSRRKGRRSNHLPNREGAPEPPVSGLMLMPLMNGAFSPGHCMEYVESIRDSRLRDIARAEYYYFSGQAEKAVETTKPYLNHPEPSLRLSACLLYAYANLSLGEIQRARYAMARVRGTLSAAGKNAPPQLRALVVFAFATVAILLHLPLPEDVGSLQEEIRFLPPGLQMFALYVQAHLTYLQGDYGKSLGIAEAALDMQMEVYPIPAIYLHLAAVMDCINLKQPEQAQAHLLTAWQLAQPDDLIEGFGEHHGLLGGMLEVVLKKDWPEDFKRIIAITYRFSAGWRKVHNPVTGDAVADNLTTTEFTIAMLATRGWSNQEIADHMGISLYTVKNFMSSTLQKLNIKQRKDLKQYMLR